MQRTVGLVIVASLCGSLPVLADPAQQKDVVVEHGKAQRHAALWTAIGGTTLVAGAVTLGFVERDRYDSAVARGDKQAADSARTIARDVGTPLFIGGVAALGVAAVLYVTAPKLRERHVIVSPVAGGDQVGVSFSGGF